MQHRSKFRTVETSNPRFEVDHLRYITVKTPNLKGRGDIVVFIPPGTDSYDTGIPVVILLHGVYGSCWAWTHNAGVHLQAMKMIESREIPPMVIAMPSDGMWGDGSGYLAHNGYEFENWIAEDVIWVLSENISGVKQDSPLFIAGLSMGGFGALRIGAKYGEKFKGISGHSSITGLAQMMLFVEENISNYFQPDKTDEEVFCTFLEHRYTLPPIRFDCGISDPLIEFNRKLHNELSEARLPHEYYEYPGTHSWDYWEEHISKSLLFFAKQLERKLQ